MNNEIKQLKMKYFVLKLDDKINGIKLKNLILSHISDTLDKEIKGNDLALYIINSIIEDNKNG